MKDFVYANNWFDQKYRIKSDCRYWSFKVALNLLRQSQVKPNIVETGCARQDGDWGGGQSTLLFCDFIRQHGGRLWSVDLSPDSCRAAQWITKDFADLRTIIENDSVAFLHSLPGDFAIDLLYLDSWDYPYGQLLNHYGGQTDINAAMATIEALGDEEVIRRHGDIIAGCQEHTVLELKAATPHLHQKSIVLIDDNNLAGGGKSRVAKDLLRGMGWTCVMDWQQTVWIKW